MNRLVASTILENYGCTIIEAVNGQHALDALEKNKADLVLMDIQMPILNGYDATRAIRKTDKKLPVIALTANAIKGENEKCYKAGMNDYIAKPFKEEEFLKKIAYWLKSEISISVENKASDDAENIELYDLSGLDAISKGNKDFVIKMVTLFCDQTPPLIKQMKTAHANKNLETMGAIAHKIKPSIDNLKIESLKQVIRKIENYGKQNIDAEDLPDLINTTELTISKVVNKMYTTFINP